MRRRWCILFHNNNLATQSLRSTRVHRSLFSSLPLCFGRNIIFEGGFFRANGIWAHSTWKKFRQTFLVKKSINSKRAPPPSPFVSNCEQVLYSIFFHRPEQFSFKSDLNTRKRKQRNFFSPMNSKSVALTSKTSKNIRRFLFKKSPFSFFLERQVCTTTVLPSPLHHLTLPMYNNMHKVPLLLSPSLSFHL